MSRLVEHARRELNRTDLLEKEGMYGDMLGHAVLELIEVFSKQGHSGMSASIVRQLFDKLSNFENLTPLTSNPDEWDDVSYQGNPLWQNKRNSAVFSNDGGKTWWHIDEDKNETEDRSKEE